MKNNSQFSILNSQLKKDIPFIGHTVSALSTYAMARYNGIGYIVVFGTDRRLYAYNAVTGEQIWRSVVTDVTAVHSHVGIADFNNDGIPEVYTGNDIFSLPTGALLCSGGNNNKGAFNIGLANDGGRSTIAVDITGDGKLELCAGTQIYRVDIPHGATTAGVGTMTVISELPTESLPAKTATDGVTLAADIDNDGQLEIIVISRAVIDGSDNITLYVWKPLTDNASHIIGYYLMPAMNGNYSIPAIGRIDDCPYPEIVFITNAAALSGSKGWNMFALRYEPTKAYDNRLELKWFMMPTGNASGCSGITLFDFDLDGINEIVIRDEQSLHIINGRGNSPSILHTYKNVRSGTWREQPVIADVDGDGQAEIILQGWDGISDHSVGGITAGNQNGYLRILKSDGSNWAWARKVWNQYCYYAVHINEDLTVPHLQLNPATAFPGKDGKWDIRPFNGVMMQQTKRNNNGLPFWLTHKTVLFRPFNRYTVSGDSVSIHVGIVNKGDAAIVPPFYATLYKESVSPSNIITTTASHQLILPGDTGYVTLTIPDVTLYKAVVHVIARINDDGSHFPVQPECDVSNQTQIHLNPYLSSLMKKDAILFTNPPLQHNGTYANPVSVLFNEIIEYKITAVNVSMNTGAVIISDTLPAFMHYIPKSATDGGTLTTGSTVETHPRDVLIWTFRDVAPKDTRTVAYRTTPASGVCASQPLFINKALVTVSDTLHIPTGNKTYHQGAGVSIVTFSQSVGGTIYNAASQALDYKTSPRRGIIIAPDEGYRFAGWSHDDYRSLRGEIIKAQSGIMQYDSLTLYGSVDLKANFIPVDSGHEAVSIEAMITEEQPLENGVWVFNGYLYVKRITSGSSIRIYTPDGILHKTLTNLPAGETKIPLPQGIYIVTIDNGTGKKVMIK